MAIRNLIEQIAAGWPGYHQKVRVDRNDPIYALVVEQLPQTLQHQVAAFNTIIPEGSTGAGNITAAPWIALFDRRLTTSATSGFYVVYLFCTDALRARYGDECMISCCKVLHVLEAAHIRAYRGEADNHPENGLLLRADLHTLFDLDLLGIHPSTLAVHLHPDLHSAEYIELQGRRVSHSGDKRPSKAALTVRWEAFQQRVASDRKKNKPV